MDGMSGSSARYFRAASLLGPPMGGSLTGHMTSEFGAYRTIGQCNPSPALFQMEVVPYTVDIEPSTVSPELL